MCKTQETLFKTTMRKILLANDFFKNRVTVIFLKKKGEGDKGAILLDESKEDAILQVEGQKLNSILLKLS